MNDKIFICRCEDILQDEIEQAIEEGYTTLEEIKCKLRLGMGPCQGRSCLSLARGILCQKADKTTEEITLPTSRPPVVPISLGTLASDEK